MKIGIIQTGAVRNSLAARFGEYPPMFARMVSPWAPDASFETVALVEGAPLPAPTDADAWIVTGSRHGVYDHAEVPWIRPLEAWLREARGARSPLIGVCFGHQILASAFGGEVAKFEGGWRLGRIGYEAVLRPEWASALPEAPRLHAVHQDQVLTAPSDAALWLTEPGCAHAGLIYGPPEAPDAISLQPHPEFDAPFARALTDYLAESGAAPRDRAEEASAGIGAPVDNEGVARAFAAFLRLRAAAKAA